MGCLFVLNFQLNIQPVHALFDGVFFIRFSSILFLFSYTRAL